MDSECARLVQHSLPDASAVSQSIRQTLLVTTLPWPQVVFGRQSTPASRGHRSSITKLLTRSARSRSIQRTRSPFGSALERTTASAASLTATEFINRKTAGEHGETSVLRTSEHIGRIAIDPKDSNIVYIASQGPLWGPGGERGLYKTTDGGKTWKSILNISENTGVTDVVIDPNDPNTIYCASYQRRRHMWTLINGGPESAIYKSTDAGATWNKLRAGLPTVELGRIGLAISPVDSNVIYATVEAADRRGGIFRSSDRGGSWERRNEFDSTAMYYSRIVADPKDVDRIYVMNVFLMVSDDGGRTLRRLGEKNKHVDNHDIWIDPANTDHYLVGCDGGIYESYDRGQNWDFKQNLPVPQFYDITTDNAKPFYNIYGGTQDNFSFGGPSRTRSASGITNADWFVTNGGDGFRSQVDPEDPNTIYATLQHGVIVRFDKRTGERIGIQPQPGRDEDPPRWNWDTPFIISPHSPHATLHRFRQALSQRRSWRDVDGNQRPTLARTRSRQAAGDGKSLEHRRGCEKRFDSILRQCLGARRVAEEGWPDLCRH